MTEIPEYKNWITSGNLITIGVLVVSGIIAFTVLQTTQAIHAKTLDDHSMRLRAMELGFARIEEALKPISRMDDRIRSIEKAVTQ